MLKIDQKQYKVLILNGLAIYDYNILMKILILHEIGKTKDC